MGMSSDPEYVMPSLGEVQLPLSGGVHVEFVLQVQLVMLGMVTVVANVPPVPVVKVVPDAVMFHPFPVPEQSTTVRVGDTLAVVLKPLRGTVP